MGMAQIVHSALEATMWLSILVVLAFIVIADGYIESAIRWTDNLIKREWFLDDDDEGDPNA